MAITNATLAQQIADLVEARENIDTQFQEWLTGVVGGGVSNDGRYPLTDYFGVTRYTLAPAALEDTVGGSAGDASASAAAALVSEDNAGTSETNASADEVLADGHRIAAEAAKTLAETARDTSVNASVNATASQIAAALSETNAAASETAAGISESNASDSEIAAAASAAAAATFDPLNFYLRTALDGGQLDNRYYTETEVDTAFGLGFRVTPSATEEFFWDEANSRYVFETNFVMDSRVFTGAKFDNWQTAFGWGDHSGLYSLSGHNHSGVYEPVDGTIVRTGDAAWNASDWDTAFGWGNHAGLYEVTDPKLTRKNVAEAISASWNFPGVQYFTGANALRIANDSKLLGLNNAETQNVDLLRVATNDTIQVGQSSFDLNIASAVMTVAGTLYTGSDLEVNSTVKFPYANNGATAGKVYLEGYYTATDNLAVLGSMRSSGNTMLGRGVKPSPTVNDGFQSSAGNSAFGRSAVVMGGNRIGLWTAATTTTAVGSPVTLTEAAYVSGSNFYVNGNIVVTGSVDGVDIASLISAGTHSASYAENIVQYNRFGAVQDMDAKHEPGIYGGYAGMTNGPTGASYDPYLVMGSDTDVRSMLVVPRTINRPIAYQGYGSGAAQGWHYTGWTTTAADAQLSLYAKLADPSFTGTVNSSGQRAFWAGTNGAFVQVGGNGSGQAGVLGSRINTDGAVNNYGTYWAYDCYWNDTTDQWVANLTTLGRKWKTEMGYHTNTWNVSYYNGVVSSPWDQADWTELMSLNSSGVLTVGTGVETNALTFLTASPDITIPSGHLDVRNATAGAYGIRILNSASATQGYLYTNGSGQFGLLHSGGGWAVQIQPSGTAVDILPNLNAQSGIDVTGNITVTGTVDGVDIASGAPDWDDANSWGDHAAAGYAPTASPTFTGAVNMPEDVGLPYGIHGNYASAGGSSTYGATIWSIDTAYNGGTAGANSAITSVYGIRWLRSTHTNAATSIGEGLYVYQDGSLKGGIGTGGIYSSTTVYATTGVNIGNLTDSTITRLSAAKLGVEGKALLKHAGSYVSGEVTFSTSAPSGGSNGDIWFEYT